MIEAQHRLTAAHVRYADQPWHVYVASAVCACGRLFEGNNPHEEEAVADAHDALNEHIQIEQEG